MLADGALQLQGDDGSTARCVPLVPLTSAAADAGPGLVAAFVEHVQAPSRVVLLLVRRGGYGVGLLEGGKLVASKVGTRYVQSRTAAGGWSQQRFARRRDNQAGQLVDAAVTTTIRLVLGDDGRTPQPGLLVVTGGDRSMVERLLADRRMAALAALEHPRHLEVPDPRQDVLRRAAEQAVAVLVDVVNS